jgi:hypothetical protein
MFPSSFRRAGLALAVAAAAACTKVREQPVARVVPVAPEPAPLTKAVRRPPAKSSGWSTGWSDPAPKPEAPTEAVAGGTPFSRAKLQAALEAALPGLNPCWPNGTVAAATISFDSTGAGKAENVRVAGASSPEQEKCVADHLAGLSLPSFDGPSVGVQLPITVGIRGLTQAADSPGAPPAPAPAAPTTATAAAAAPAAAPLFINP